MSAWYVFSALGFYPVCPGSDQYAIGSPMVRSAIIQLENGKSLEIRVENQSEDHVLVKEVRFNGEKISGNSLHHEMLIAGGLLTFIMK
jgi:putative alpha-1,2-mannosidase